MCTSRQGIINELHKQSRKRFRRRPVILKGIDDLWQIDLVEMVSYSDQNDKNKYILTVIDCFSKYAWAIPLKNKKGQTVSKSLEHIFKTSNRIPKNLQSDMGTEFYNKIFQELIRKYHINHYSTYTSLKASIVERFNRTLKNDMWKLFSYHGSYRYVDKLKHILNIYNNRRHRTIKMTPVEASNPENEQLLLNNVYKYNRFLTKNKFNIGDPVRITKLDKAFTKGYLPRWSTEIFQIIDINNKSPVTYLLQDYQKRPIAGRFYEQELQKTKYPDDYLVEKVVKRRGKKIKVKWLGFDDTHNSWINKEDLI